VQDVPGVTRDRVAYDAQWRGRRFTVLDTGGWDPDAVGLQQAVAAQAEIAVAAADAVLFVVDATVGATDSDEAVVKVLRPGRQAGRAGGQQGRRRACGVRRLAALVARAREPYPVSALHGRGSGDLLDVVLEALPETPAERFEEEGGPRRVALVGRPNVGKSSLLNRLAGEQRVVVDSTAGTTRDPVDSLVEVGGTTYRFVDTAGLRRRVAHASGAEYYSSLRTSAPSTRRRSRWS
jgi:GTP-binding protein